MTLMARLLTSSAVVMVLAGCTEFHDAAKQESDFMSKSDTMHVPGEGLISVSDTPYLVGEPIAASESVPTILLRPGGLELSRPVSLRDAALQASVNTGIRVRVMPDAEDDGDDGDGLPAGAAPSFNGVSLPAPPQSVLGSSPAGAGRTSRRRHSVASTWRGQGAWFEYVGNCEGLFSTLAMRFGVSQKWTGGEVEFFRNITKTYIVPAFDGDEASTTSIMSVTGGGGSSSGGGSGGGMGGGMGGGGMGGMGGSGSGGGSSESQGMAGTYEKITTNRWKKLEDTVLMVGKGADVVTDPSLGTLTVTGTPDQIVSVDNWYSDFKDMLMKQVAVTIRVYSVKIDRESNYGYSPTVAAKQFGKYFAASVSPATIPTIQSQDVPFSFGASIVKGTATGTNLAVQALQSLNNVTEIDERGVVTTNGVSAPFQRGTNTTYIQNAASYLATNAGSSASISPGVVMSGFEGAVTPRVIGNQILLNLHVVMQTLLSLANLSGNNSVSIQGPKTSSTMLTDKVVLNNGEMLVLSGYVGDSTSRTQNGVGSALNWLAGGGGDAETIKDRVLITVEAHTL
jgi:type IVB pilus formation R64 PilN family outer membrane protein